MKIKFLTFGFILIFPNFSLNSKSMMPGLDKMKEKVKKAIEGTDKLNFKDYLDQKKSKTSEKISGPQSEFDFDTTVKDFYWCKQSNLISKLESKLTNKDEALSAIKCEISTQYKNKENTFLLFASDLIKEKNSIEILITQAMKNMQSGNSSDVAKKKNDFNQLIVLNTTISKLIKLVEKLFKL